MFLNVLLNDEIYISQVAVEGSGTEVEIRTN